MDMSLVRHREARGQLQPRCAFDDLSIDILLQILEALGTCEDIIHFAIAYRPAYAVYRRHGRSVMQNVARRIISTRNIPVALSCLFLTRYPSCGKDVLRVFRRLHAQPPRDLSFMDLASLWALVRLASHVNDLAVFYLYAAHSPLSHDKFWRKLYHVGHVTAAAGVPAGHRSVQATGAGLFDARRPNFASVKSYFWRLRRRSRRRARRWPSAALAHAENMIYQLEMRSRFLWLLNQGYPLPFELGGANATHGAFRFVGFIESVFFHKLEQDITGAEASKTGKLARLACIEWIRARCCLGVKLWARLLKAAETGIDSRLGRTLWVQMIKLSNDGRMTARIPPWHWEMRDDG